MLVSSMFKSIGVGVVAFFPSLGLAQDFEKPYVGLSVMSVEEAGSILSGAKLPSKTGVMITHVAPESTGAKANLTVGTVITHVGRDRVLSVDQYKDLVGNLEIGKPVQITGFGYQGSKFAPGKMKIESQSYDDYLKSAAKIKKDEFSGRETITSPYDESMRGTHIDVWLSVEGDEMKHRFRIYYQGNLLPDAALVKTDSKTYEFSRFDKDPAKKFGEVNILSGGFLFFGINPPEDFCKSITTSSKVSLRIVDGNVAKDEDLPRDLIHAIRFFDDYKAMVKR